MSGLIIHAAESTIYSAMPRLLPMQVADDETISDALYEAEDAIPWRILLHRLQPNLESHTTSPNDRFSKLTDNFLPTVLLAQEIVNLCTLQDIGGVDPSVKELRNRTSDFYKKMHNLSRRFAILSMSPRCLAPSQPQSLRILWHYCCITHLTKMDMIEEAAGRGGPPSPMSADRILADLRDLAFIVPRYVSVF